MARPPRSTTRNATPAQGADAGAKPLPSREAVKQFIRDSAGRVGKNEIARAFGIAPEHRAALRDLLRGLEREGAVDPAGARRYRPADRLPETMVVQISGIDPDGEPIARPVGWQGEGPPPLILMAAERSGQAALAPGQRVLARLRPLEDRPGKRGGPRYEGRTLKWLDDAPGRVIGLFRAAPPAAASAAPGRGRPAGAAIHAAVGQGGGRITPTDRRSKSDWRVPPGEEAGAQDGEIVQAVPLPHAGLGLKPVRIIERLGRMGDARSVSLICIATHDIPQVFSPACIAEAATAAAVPLGERTDLRALNLVTIDGEDARDFDDAVHAEPDGDGFRLTVAIADVAHYVPADGALDRDAWTRGNSVYFPDRVVPMLPEALSNGWCSLRPGEDRGCLFVRIRIGPDGRKRDHHFGRGLMRSAARLTYEQLQQAADGVTERGTAGAAPEGVPAGVLVPLYDAFRALLAARRARGTLELDLPERKVVLDDAGQVVSVQPRPRLDSHRLIEEFMVLANVCAAEELERLRMPCMYRVHAPPSADKLDALRDFLHGLSISLPPGDQLHPRDLDRVLQRVAGTPEAPLVNEVMLRSQSQAAYSPDNFGHFGLALTRYAHFTSPIRRYADLLVHRALIRGLKLGRDGLRDDEVVRMTETAEHITATERRAALAEREAIDRYLAAHMADKIGALFNARISGVTRGALFVTIDTNGASGIVPVSTLPDDFWMHDERTHSLSGRRTRLTFSLAQQVEVRLAEAAPVTGGLVFNILQGMPAKTRRDRR